MRRQDEASTLQCMHVILSGVMIAVGFTAIVIGIIAITTRDTIVPVDPNVFARYCDGPCGVGQIPYFLVADCLSCVNFNASSGTVSLRPTNFTCVGTGVCPIDDSFGPDLTALSFTDSGYTTVSRVGNDINFDTSLPATFVQTCGVPAPCSANERLTFNGSCALCVDSSLPTTVAVTCGVISACNVNERLSYNGSCITCVPISSGGLPLCGSCAIGQYITLGVNGTCLDCVTTGNWTLPSDLIRTCGAISSCTSTQRLWYNGTCAECLELPAVNTTLPATVVQTCGAIPSCTSTQRLWYNGTCSECLELPMTPVTNLTCTGTAVCTVTDGTGDDLTVASVRVNGELLTAELSAGELVINGTLPVDVARTCGVIPACTSTQRISTNGTCLTCVDLPVGNATSPTNLTCTGTAVCPVTDGDGTELSVASIRVNGELLTAEVSAGELVINGTLPADVGRTCGVLSACNSMQRLSTNGSCFTCVDLPVGNATSPNNLTCTGTAVCLVTDGAGTELSVASIRVNGELLTAEISAGELVLNGTLPSNVIRSCGAISACSSTQRLSYNGSCSVCLELPTFNETAAVSLNCTGTGVCPVTDGIGNDLTVASVRVNGELLAVEISSGELVINGTLPADVMRSCGATPACTSTQRLSSNGTCAVCLELPTFNTTAAASLNCSGTGVCPVTDGIGNDLTVASVRVNGELLTAEISAGELVINGTLPADVIRACGVTPACTSTQRLSSNGTCSICLELPTFNATAAASLNCTGAGVCPVTDGIGNDLTMASVRVNGELLTAEISAGELVINGTLPTNVLRSCGSIPVCTSMQRLSSNGTCAVCLELPAFNETAATTLNCTGTGVCPVTDGIGNDLTVASVRVNGELLTAEISLGELVINGTLPANVLRSCGVTPACTSTQRLSSNGTCSICLELPTFNTTAAASLNCTGAGVCPVTDGIGNDLTVASVRVNGELLTAEISAGELVINGTLPADVLRSCGATPVCTSTQRLSSNGTCSVCLELPAAASLNCTGTGVCPVTDGIGNDLTVASVRVNGELLTAEISSGELVLNGTLPANVMRSCGATPVCTSTQRLSSNGTCSVCLELPVQTPPSSTGNGTSIIANSTTNTFKSIAGSGSTTIVDAVDKITVNSPVLVSTFENFTSATPAFITDTSFEVLSSSATVELRPRTYQYATFVSTPSSVNCIVSSVYIGWWHERVVSEDASLLSTNAIFRTHNVVVFQLEVSASGFFRFNFDDGTFSDHLGPNNADFFIGGGGLNCDPSFSVVLSGGIHVYASNGVTVSGSAPAYAFYVCTALWTHDSYY